MIKLSGITKVFKTEEVDTYALNDVSLEIGTGEYVSIMGPSGCGKSTLLNIIGLLDKPDTGSYLLDGGEMTGLSEKQKVLRRKGSIGFIFQSFNLIDELTVAENVELPLIYLREPAVQRRRKVNAILDKLNIRHREKHFPQQLSGGQQQRVAVGRALIMEPELILADEPTGNLDSGHGDEVMELLNMAHAGGTTIVMVTHSPQYADYARRVVNLFDGRVITERGGTV